MLNRRQFFGAFAASAALYTVCRAEAIEGGTPSDLDRWAQGIADLNRELAAGRIALIEWQTTMAALDSGLDLAALKGYLDFDRLTAAMNFPEKLAQTADPKFPEQINIDGIERSWFIRIFGMRQGGAIIPHVHNNMVSAHLVLEGQFRARTFDREADMPDPTVNSVMLRPKINETLKPGQMVTMSDDRDNCHWLVAETDRSFTFDVGVLELSKTRLYTLPANEYSMIFVDPTAEQQDGYGLIRAPVMTFKECVAKFAA
jgi:hypothetical protein